MNGKNEKNSVKKYALLAAYSFPKRRITNNSARFKYLFKNTRKVNMNSKILKKYEIVSDLSTNAFSTLQNEIDKEIVMSIRGTDFTMPEDGDILTDALLLFGLEKSRNCYKNSYNNLKNIIAKYKDYKITLVGTSLGARLCIDLLDSDLGKHINIVHAYNTATSLTHLYRSADCFLKRIPSKKIRLCENRTKLHIHMINNDPISILSMGEKSKTRRVYDRKYKSSKLFQGKKNKIKTNHSIMNFV